MTADPARHAREAEKTLGDYLTAHDLSPADLLGFAQVHALLAIESRLAQFGVALERAAMADVGHPPVPEQAITAAQVQMIEDSAHLWAGWQPGTWPVPDLLDPRGFRWADPLRDGG